ncbi:MAG: hypothetical protein HOF49_00500 [Nitrosomonadales bacterium]|jgi:2-methylfumaryl-CoA hydratase|nr:hypothetical protein [Nitrosomonadales bacterium]MBT3918621.1 hypothetical protein [Nitrosomonadales bacterium]MBT4183421.1 hypothetical protein [Nitrosomonadales bacterium]MBT6015295.1 hypothetical protein [Nitrosomonadales bacterium]MBT6250549.1 hypothetical protein [Nitrosomonadales bacterium]
MSKLGGNFLEDFQQGDIIYHAMPRTITSGDASMFLGLTGTRYPLFCAKNFANSLGFESTPIDDILLFNIAFSRTVQDISLNAVANLGYAEVIFHSPVFFGDTISSKSEIIGIKENSNKTNGIVYVHSSSFNQQNKMVLSWKRWVMIPKKDKNKTIKEVVPKNIKPEVAVGSMHIPDFLKTNNFDEIATGSSLRWDDYHENDEINHSRGLTIDEASHTLATHLYQNDAKLHFNAHQMKASPFKKRLVYGGHVISLCRSIAHEGLENSLIITAIHAGTHSNPVLADDTLYSKTIIVGKDKLPNHQDIGILKLKLIGIKNQIPSSLKSIYQQSVENKIYNKNVVLDLDYSIVVPRGK